MYTNPLGRMLLSVLGSKPIANLKKNFLDSPLSALLVDPFIKKNKISLKDYNPKRYHSFNDFFTRELKYCARNFEISDEILTSPSDGRISAYKINHNSRFLIKNSYYSVNSLLRDSSLARHYRDGYFVLIRLCVDNYHHYTYSVAGLKSCERRINGFLHSVNPVVNDYVKVYKENSRNYSVILTDEGHRITQMEVGAMGVGKICNEITEEAYVMPGYKKGHFEFGGSSIILLIPKGSYMPDADIIKNTSEGYETEVKIGEKIGTLIH